MSTLGTLLKHEIYMLNIINRIKVCAHLEQLIQTSGTKICMP